MEAIYKLLGIARDRGKTLKKKKKNEKSEKLKKQQFFFNFFVFTFSELEASDLRGFTCSYELQ